MRLQKVKPLYSTLIGNMYLFEYNRGSIGTSNWQVQNDHLYKLRQWHKPQCCWMPTLPVVGFRLYTKVPCLLKLKRKITK